MRLYHFTNRMFLFGIMKEVIRLGMIPVSMKPEFVTGYQCGKEYQGGGTSPCQSVESWCSEASL